MTVSGVEQAQTRWDRHIPHYELTAELLPTENAPWDELVFFAGAFDGPVVAPTPTGPRELAWESRRRFLAEGSLPDGLTMLRAALHGEQRIDYWSDEPGQPEPDAMRHVHALVEAIRSVVKSGRHTSPDASTEGGVRDKVMNAFDRLLAGYASWGGYRYHGWSTYEDERNYHGPVIWSERDCGLRFALELEREWPRAVHMEFAIAKSSRLDYEEIEGRQRVDIAVSDLSTFAEDDHSFERFRARRHDAFFEVKWFVKGWDEMHRDARNRLDQVPRDLAKLANHLRLGRCAVAGMLVVDDGEVFQQHAPTDDWPTDVWRLYVGRSALVRRKLIGPDT